MSIRGLLRSTPGRATSMLVGGDRELVLERAYAIARVTGGALAIFVAPSFGLSLPLALALIGSTVALPGMLHMWLWRRTKSAAGRERQRK